MVGAQGVRVWTLRVYLDLMYHFHIKYKYPEAVQ